MNLKIVDPSGDHAIYTLQFNRAAKTAKLLEMKAYNPAGYMIGGQTYDNTDIQIQEGSNLESRVSLDLVNFLFSYERVDISLRPP